MILFGYDGSDEARHAIEVAAGLLAGRAAVVVDVAQVLTRTEVDAVVTPGIDLPLLQHLNQDVALERAEAGTALAGWASTPSLARSSPHRRGRGSSRWRTTSMRR